MKFTGYLDGRLKFVYITLQFYFYERFEDFEHFLEKVMVILNLYSSCFVPGNVKLLCVRCIL